MGSIAGATAVMHGRRALTGCAFPNYCVQSMNTGRDAMPGTEEHIIRCLLTAIEDDAQVSQRRLSGDIGIAVGSVNWYLKRCLNKGLIKLQHAPVKRYLYYLTPKGFEEKSRLTAAFLQRSFELYRQGRSECADFFSDCQAKRKERIFLAGDGDLAEIACLSGLNANARVNAVVDSAAERPSCAGAPVFPNLQAAVAETGGSLPDVILLTDLRRPRRCYHELAEQALAIGVGRDIIHVLPLLKFAPT